MSRGTLRPRMMTSYPDVAAVGLVHHPAAAFSSAWPVLLFDLFLDVVLDEGLGEGHLHVFELLEDQASLNQGLMWRRAPGAPPAGGRRVATGAFEIERAGNGISTCS